MAVKADNRIEMSIEEDGNIKVNTDSFEQGEVHLQANQLVTQLKNLTGTKEAEIIQKKPHDHGHTHVHNTQKA